ncbi:MAG: hypothetical protein CM15mP13_3500 [Pseudomonadota bacterium]|nr:MAG: hypothetical protein CM15mP13_3500 [Pseudomonadota bacterium]
MVFCMLFLKLSLQFILASQGEGSVKVAFPLCGYPLNAEKILLSHIFFCLVTKNSSNIFLLYFKKHNLSMIPLFLSLVVLYKAGQPQFGAASSNILLLFAAS